jgi:hypothetical protein
MCDLVDDRVKFGERLVELQAEFLLADYGDEGVGIVYMNVGGSCVIE